jgi:putative polyhydroxyalkanoate system protein
MGRISVRRDHGLEGDEVRVRIETMANKLAQRLGGSWHWQGDEAVSEVRGIQARVGYDESSISVDIALPRLMSPLQRKLESKVDEYLERLLG